MVASLSNLLGKLSASQLATITFESGIDSNGQVTSASFEGYIAQTTTAANPGSPPATTQVSTWQTRLGAGATVSYTFLNGTAAYAFSALEQDYATQALQLWSGVANINFAYRVPAQGAQVAFVHSFDKLPAQPNPISAGTAWSPGAMVMTQTTGLVQQTNGFVQIDNTSTQGGAPSYGSISSYTVGEGFGIDSLIHEAGHLLGLGHAGPYNSTGPTDKTDFATLQNNNTDVLQWSVMSYISPNATTAPNYGKYNALPSDTTEASWGAQRAPFSPMGMDIFAAQRLYGAPTSTMFGGGKTFGFNSTVMYKKIDGTQGKLSMFDFDQTFDSSGNPTHLNDETPVLTLFDTGANNTFDVSGFTTASDIDLRDGEFSSVATLHDNIFIEYGTQIDHVIGGAGNDTFTVNGRSNVIDGGGGNNLVKFLSPRSAYVLSYSGASAILTNASSGAAYSLTNIQRVQFGADPAIALSDLPRVQWTGPSGGHFGIAANWSDKQVPNAASQVQIYSGANILVTQQEANEVDSLVMAAGATIDITSGRFVINNASAGSTNAGKIYVESGYTLYLAGGLTNIGTLALYGGTLVTNSRFVTLSGGGTVDFQGGHIGGRDASGSPVAYDTFTNVDNVISGFGSIGRAGFLYPLQIHNAENANVVATGGTLQVSGAITNDGIMGASNDGVLDLSGGIDQTSGGRIVSLGVNAKIVLDGGTITGGSIAAVTGMVEIGANETLSGVNLSGAFKVDSGFKLTLVGDIDATGATIDATAGTIDLSQAHVTGGSIKFSPNQSLDGLTVSGADLSGYVIGHNQTVTVNGALTNRTTLNIAGYSGYAPAILAISGVTTLSGGGAVILSDSYGALGDVSFIAGSAASDTLENMDNTIRGFGELGQGMLGFNNDSNGTVNATAGTLRLWTVGSSNSGLIESTGGLLVIESVLNCGGGIILAADKGRVQLGGDGRATSVTAGILRSAGSGVINVDSAGVTFDGSSAAVNQQAALHVTNRATLTTKGVIANTGTIYIDGYSGYGPTTLAVAGATTLQGGGSVVMVDNYGAAGDVAAIGGSSTADVLTNADNRIYGYGSIGKGALALVNAGSIEASGGTLTVDTGAATITNRGTFEGYGGTLVVNSPVVNTGSILGTTGGGVTLRKAVLNNGGIYFTVDSRLVLDGSSLGGSGSLAIDTNATIETRSAGTIDGTTQRVTLAGTAVIDNTATLTVLGAIVNSGTVVINGYSGYGTTTLKALGPVTLSGGGSVRLQDGYGALGNVAAIGGASTADVLTNVDNVISGYGAIGRKVLTLDNRGTINATAGTLTVDTGSAVITNSGLLEAVGGTLIVASAVADSGRILAGASGTVVLQSVVNGTGSLQAAAGGTVVLDGGSLANTGGVGSVATGVIEVVSSGSIDGTRQSVALAGTVLLDHSTTLTLKGAVANSGAIVVNGYSGYGPATLAVSGAVTLLGGGTITLQDSYGAFGNVAAIGGASTADVLTNVDNVISGYGAIGRKVLTLDNRGTINATAGTLTVDTGSAVITNSGLLEAVGGRLIVASAVANSGRIVAGGSATVVRPGVVTGTVVLQGAVTGTGSVQAAAGGVVVLDGSVLVNTGGVGSVATGMIEVVSTGGIDGMGQSVALAGTVLLDQSTTLTLKGAIANSGAIMVNGYSGYGLTTLVMSGPVTLSGGGTVTLQDGYGAFGNVSAIAGASSADVLTNVDNVISGYGELGRGKLSVVNQVGGVINASAATLRIDAAVTNSGLLEATGGTLRLETTVVNAGATILAAGGSVMLGGDSLAATIQGGTLRSTGSGSFGLDQLDATLDGTAAAVTLEAKLTVNAGLGAIVKGAIANRGTIALNGYSGYGPSRLGISGAVTLSGGGSVTMADTYGAFGDVAAIVGGSAADTLDNVDNTISGYGHIKSLTLTNEAAGIVDATSGTLTIDTAAAGAALTNKGLLESLGGALVIDSNTVNTGTILAGLNGTTRLQRVVSNAGAVRAGAGGKLVLDGGAVAGTGTLASAVGGTIEVVSGGVISGVGQTVTLGGTTVVDAGALLVLGGVIGNTGAIAINGYSGFTTTTVRVTGPTTLTGGGYVTLSDAYGANGNVSALTGSSVSDVLDNVDNTISGYGALGAGTMSFINEAGGVVNATAATLTLNFGNTTAVNSGLLEATGGTLAITSKIGGTGRVLAAGGNVSFAVGAATNLVGATLTSGSWTARGGTLTFADALTADAATLVLSGAGSTVTANGSSIETTLSSIATGGSLQVLGGLAWNGTTSLANAGELRLGGGTFTTTTLANTGRIDGTGTIRTAVTGAGIIEAAGGTLTLAKQVSGALVVDAGSTMVVKGGAAAGTTLRFAGPGGTVQIVPGAGSQPFNGRVLGSMAGETIDLVGVAATGTRSGSTLTLSYGGGTIGTVTFDPGYVGSVASDGHGGTLITGASPDPLFDIGYYEAQYGDVAAAGIDPYQHYMSSGWKEGRNPSALFNTSYYLNQNPDVKAAGVNPLMHFETDGWLQGRDPSIGFSVSGYLAAYTDVKAAGVNPLVHYVTGGKAEGRVAVAAVPHATGPADPLVEAAYVYAHNPGVAGAGLDAAAWYHSVGWKQGADPSALFSTTYYLNQNLDVKGAGIDPLAHFEASGWREGRDPSVGFSLSGYLAAYPDVKAAGIDPLVHYVGGGKAEGRTAFAATPHATGPQDPLIDAAYVYAHNPAIATAGLDASAWFNSVGWQQGANPDGFFDTNYFLTQNPDVRGAGINPLAHFEGNGWREGRQPSLVFDDAKYLAANSDVKAAGLNPLAHYVSSGHLEGRMAFLMGDLAAIDPLVDVGYYDKQLGATIVPGGVGGAQQAAWSYDHDGWQKGLNPNAFFDTNYYLSHNADIATAHIDPLAHYEASGWKEGRDPSAAFSTNKYLAAYGDVKAAGLDPLVHFLQSGQAEGRTAFTV